MGTLVTTPAITSSPEILSPRPDIQEMFAHLRTAAKYLKTATMMIAYYGCRLRKENAWEQFGYASEDSCRKALGVPQSSWYKALRIGEALFSLSFEDLQQISVGNAELLIQVQPELWQDFPWVLEAKRLPPGEFAELITMRNQSAGSDREPMARVSWKVPCTAKPAIEEMVRAFMNREGLKTPGHALEMLVADLYDRSNLGALIMRACEDMFTISQELSREDVPAARRIRYAEKLRDVRRILNEGYQKEIRKAEFTAGH